MSLYRLLQFQRYAFLLPSIGFVIMKGPVDLVAQRGSFKASKYNKH